MAIRLLCSTILATVVALSGCTDKSSHFTSPTTSDNNELNGPDGGNANSSPKVGGNSNPNTDGSSGTAIVDNTGKGKAKDGSSSIGAPVQDGYDDPGSPEPVPEPGTILLFGVGVTGLAFYRRRRNNNGVIQSV